MSDLIIGFLILFVLVIPPMFSYNSLVSKRNQISNIFSTMDVLLKKRWDLVPNLVSTVKGYADHERQLFENIAEQRSKALVGQLNPNQQVDLDNQVTQLIGIVYATVESYPQLKASENFMHLQRTLNELEEQISAARRAFNASVTDYNNAVQMFPSSIIANIGGFTAHNYLNIHPTQRENLDISKILKSDDKNENT